MHNFGGISRCAGALVVSKYSSASGLLQKFFGENNIKCKYNNTTQYNDTACVHHTDTWSCQWTANHAWQTVVLPAGRCLLRRLVLNPPRAY